MKTGLLYYLLGMLFAGLVLSMDYQGVFIYFTYLPVYVGGAVYVGWGLRLVRASGGGLRFWAIMMLATLIGILSIVTPYLPNGERKEFFLTASSIKKGTPETKIRRVMRNYRLTENANGSLTFSCRTRAHTEDHFVIVLDPMSRAARSVEFLAD